MTSLALLGAPQREIDPPQPKLVPAYLAYVKDENSLLKSLGIYNKALDPVNIKVQEFAKQTASAGAQDKDSDSKPSAERQVPVAKVPAKVQVASRSAGPGVDPGIVQYAATLRGIPYKFGGTTTAGFDCSGYTQYVFAKFGKNLPRDSYSQFTVGSPVGKNDLKPGDLVFFTTYAPGASHVGIYAGGGSFLDASDTGVGVNDLTRGYWGARYIGARRINK